MTSEFEEIRQQIANLARAKNARRYPQALQARITAHARMRMAAGMSVGAVCRELDVGEPTMNRFLGQRRPSEVGRAAFKRVRVVMRSAPETEGRTYVMRGPCGTCIEGLSVDEVTELLRRLSCSA
jgi:hypothetical protein